MVLDWTDPMHCGALLNTGSWLDRRGYKWQPDGCILHDYSTHEARQCFGKRQVLFIGDSTTRKLFYQTARLLDNKLPAAPPSDSQKHTNVNLSTSYGTELSFVWDPYLNSSHIHRLASGESKSKVTSRPALLVVGSGLWYLRYSNTSGGLSAWEANMERILHSIAERKTKIADSVVLLPVEQVVASKLSHERASTMRSSDIDAMNSDLLHRINPPSTDSILVAKWNGSTIPVAFPRVFNKMLEASMTEDGLHFTDHVVRAQATILINMRCNDFLPKSFPLDKTCCFRYPRPSFVHAIVLLVVILWGPYRYFKSANIGGGEGFFTFFGSEEAAPFVLSISIAAIFLADRTGIWLKEQKHFDSWTFGLLCFGSLLVGLASVKRSDKDLGLLNREQTDEWKGWMQIAILIYHYLGASKIPGIYNPIRVLVAAYLFMTGFGHTTYYLRKADFGFLRFAQVIIRLNILTLLLAYTMNTDYLSYYFAPLVSWWYLVIYCTMLFASSYNDRTLFILCKIIISALLVMIFTRQPKILEFLFGLLARLCNIQWSAREWTFRVTLDLWIVYIGMIFALAFNKFNSSRLSDDPRWPLFAKMSVGSSVVVLVWFFAFELSQESKFAYNGWHPYVSFIPILAYIVLRNATTVLRSTHSRAFAYVGKCSLETFIMQYHIWLAGDTKGVLLVIPGTRWRPINFVITTFLFIFLSDQVAQATSYITARICGGTPKILPISVVNAARNGGESGTEQHPASASERSEVKEFTMSSNITQSFDHIPLRIWTFAEKYFSTVGTRLLLIIFIMWLVNLMWPSTN
ncbi:hypothetical protein AX15_001823 [Amanita polypyramis BW_CC]|nr:hypothetical protein AX15_001823 [Amanita polypyramis BW_CC]